MTIARHNDQSSCIGHQLSAIMPEFLDELARELRQLGERATAVSLPELRLFGWCRCRDECCDSFYTTPEAPQAGSGSRRGLVVGITDGGKVMLDLCGDKIWFMEILDCPSARAVLNPLRERDLGPAPVDSDMVDWVVEINRTLGDRRAR